jgi:hypothetical protein
LDFSGGDIQWNVSFVRAAQDCKADAFASFYRLYLVRMRWEGEDRLCWAPSKKGLFGVKSFYGVLGCMIVFVSLGRVFGGLNFS